jgi:hypothetical protein
MRNKKSPPRPDFVRDTPPERGLVPKSPLGRGGFWLATPPKDRVGRTKLAFGVK